ncbi:hypothetical protein SSE37_17448 [Sagittula stellata E-37]|uniref:Uncharacterized protein n=1 Tax=Sagittula stellata (strain ATCC 700073 / DSM 11524 / E-37) TaxID=388399 RepID=A3K361_SAGS3|nr:hypothetical protein SSE37_17448 [Sagittula stellata E-37]
MQAIAPTEKLARKDSAQPEFGAGLKTGATDLKAEFGALENTPTFQGVSLDAFQAIIWLPRGQ